MQSRHRPCARLCKGGTRSNRMRVPIVVFACVLIARPIAQPADEDSGFQSLPCIRRPAGSETPRMTARRSRATIVKGMRGQGRARACKPIERPMLHS